MINTLVPWCKNNVDHTSCQNNAISKQEVSQKKKKKKKKISDVVTLGTFCYRDQSFINSRGSVIFFTEREVLNLTLPHTQSK